MYKHHSVCLYIVFNVINGDLLIVTSDSSDEEIEETEDIKNAYIPYLYAKKNIVKVIKDMKKMRSNHLHIVADIQNEYKSIEDETQVCL